MQEFKGRFAPSPTGRMHAGNVFAALLSWLSARKNGGKWILRIEDLDPQRSRREYALAIEDDLRWLGLDWDEGGTADTGPAAPYSQSLRGNIYEHYLNRLKATGLAYPCTCTRADILATAAPHRSDGNIVYGGRCRPSTLPCHDPFPATPHAVRLAVPDTDIAFTDKVFGKCSSNLARECGDFVLRRADGAWAYQLAVVVDDALMGVSEVVRGSDLLLSSPRQIYLYSLLGLAAPAFAHVPLLCNTNGQRLSKRDNSLNMEALRHRMSAPELLGRLAAIAGIIPEYEPRPAHTLINAFGWDKVRPVAELVVEDTIF